MIFPYECHKCGHVHTLFFSFFQTEDKKAWTSNMVQYNFTVTEKEFPDSKYNNGKYVVSVVGQLNVPQLKEVSSFHGVHSVYTLV